MNRKITLLKVLAMMFLISELFIGLSLIAMMVLVPSASKMVDSRHGNIGVLVGNGTPGYFISRDAPHWSLMSALSTGIDGALNYNGSNYTPLLANPEIAFGTVTFGSFRFRSRNPVVSLNSDKSNAADVVVSNLQGTVTFIHPASAEEVLESVKWPFIVSMLTTGAISIVILESIRRIFKSVESGQIFSPTNVRNVRTIGFLFVTSFFLKIITTGWLKARMAVYVMHHVAAGSIFVNSSTDGDMNRLTTGLVILAMAEVFRQ
ncbi:MAG: DUF2975 domain-containing protein, partial [Opitutaceae bacterium]